MYTLPHPTLMRYPRPPTNNFRLLIPWRRFLLEKLTSSQSVTKYPAFYGTRRFITALTKARHLSLSADISHRTKRSFQVRGTCIRFITRPVFTMRSCWHLAQPPSRRTTPCQLYATAYSIYFQYIHSCPSYWKPLFQPQTADAPAVYVTVLSWNEFKLIGMC
jgi:hypothetical protein